VIGGPLLQGRQELIPTGLFLKSTISWTLSHKEITPRGTKRLGYPKSHLQESERLNTYQILSPERIWMGSNTRYTRMGSNTSKKSSGESGPTNKIPSDSPLGQMLRYWSLDRITQGPKAKEATDD
jgi:hypothetical protein